MRDQKTKKSSEFEKKVYEFYDNNKIPYDKSSNKTPEEWAKEVIDRLEGSEQPTTIRLSGTTQPGKLI